VKLVTKTALLVLVIAICLSAVAAQAQQPRSLDDELLEDLGADPLDEFDRELFTPGEGQGRAGRPRDEDLPGAGQRNDADVTIEHDNPLVEISRRMREAQRLIGRNDSGSTTQALQEQVLADLDELIKQARKACKKCSPGDKPPQGVSARKPIGQSQPKQPGDGQKPSDKPATNSSARPKANGQAAKVDVEAVREVIKKLWGELPQNEREQMLQLPIEEFLPKYELLIEEYFRRLSEEK